MRRQQFHSPRNSPRYKPLQPPSASLRSIPHGINLYSHDSLRQGRTYRPVYIGNTHAYFKKKPLSSHMKRLTRG